MRPNSEQTEQQVQEEILAPEESEEERRVRGWRFEQFTQLGFALGAALELVDSSADLNLARTLIGGGCPPDTAYAILA